MKPILYFNDKTGESLNLGDQLKVVGYKYEHNTISEKLFRESLSIFKRDIKHFKYAPFNPAWNRPYDDVFIEFREGYWLITKLIHLYDVLVKEGGFKQPFVIDPNKEKLLSCGHGRTLIGYRYFPYLVHNYTTHSMEYGVGGDELVRKYLSLVGSGDDFDKEYVVSLLPLQDMWQIRSVNFVSKEYLSERLKKSTTRQLDPFLEKVCTFDDWLEIKSKIKLAKLETDEDYLQLLDDIISCRKR
jgi:hypothetical protein